MIKNKSYDCIVIGAGHAGVEAALASSRMGLKTLMISLSFDTVGEMSCNPAIGGVGKGQLVKEIDALGGEMGKAADRTAIQFRQLNASKGQAVRSSRCQSDREQYRLYMQSVVKKQKRLDFLADEAVEILVKNKKVKGIKTKKNKTVSSKTIIIAAGTFLNGKIHIVKKITQAGRINEPASIKLADSLKKIGLPLVNFKTGTPPRLDGKTINFKNLEIQHSDNPAVPFSFSTKEIPRNKELLPCYITATNEKTHKIIRSNMHKSPMYSGRINATGVRYCPSIEDKIKKFPDKKRHQVFLEPEGLDTDEYYPNGISTGLPEDVQEKIVYSIKGLQEVKINRFGYSIEHAVIPPTEIKHNLETKKIAGLFLSGQINGTTGYEEAAAQGLIAGINSSLKVKKKSPFILKRDEAYIGVLIDDLVTKGTEEPYRMFTSRVEYRLIIREDNADKRMSPYGYKFGLIKREDYKKIKEKYDFIKKEIEHLNTKKVSPGTYLDDVLKKIKSAPLKGPTTLSKILKRPGITYDAISGLDGKLKNLPKELVDQVEYEIKYEGYIKRQLTDVKRFRHIENIKIPENIDYSGIQGLSFEIREKLKRFSPKSLGQALRISGVTPAAISILMVYLKKKSEERSLKKKVFKK